MSRYRIILSGLALAVLAACGTPERPKTGVPKLITPEMLPQAPEASAPACSAEMAARFHQPEAGIFQVGTGPTAAGFWIDMKMAGRDGTWRCQTTRDGRVVTVTPISST
ncbi:hypothetical protein [Rhodovulum sulfidophilum]|uniref:hypothetical protein n=1 Tax=Rhodovulum sulfidophilum TaxID=35806 RepID=UPI0009522076|nr:hypothetical protein [Rhodovulum sulfidophilum]MBL3559852.1 hypothetical protein [Rhodovulum sulfidophilum]OLS51007.1 hypothetical protein BV392_02695 [Rhodovulum sulfidophilum]